MKRRLLLIDTFSLYFRCFYATSRKENFTYVSPYFSNGVPINAITPFLLKVFNAIDKYKITDIVFALESKKGNIRKEIDKTYKANRLKQPDDLIDQIPVLFEMLENLSLPLIEHDYYEADDVIGSISNQINKEKFEVYLYSSDKDLMQLIEPSVNLISMDKHSKTFLVDKETIETAFFIGALPKHVPEYKGLCGDPSDNIKGVTGIGKKRASELILKFDNIEKIYQNIDSIQNVRIKNFLIEQKENAFKSRELATINTDLKLNYDTKDFSISNINQKQLFVFLEKYNLKRLITFFQNKI